MSGAFSAGLCFQMFRFQTCWFHWELGEGPELWRCIWAAKNHDFGIKSVWRTVCSHCLTLHLPHCPPLSSAVLRRRAGGGNLSRPDTKPALLLLHSHGIRCLGTEPNSRSIPTPRLGKTGGSPGSVTRERVWRRSGFIRPQNRKTDSNSGRRDRVRSSCRPAGPLSPGSINKTKKAPEGHKDRRTKPDD